jgi:heme oxygenase
MATLKELTWEAHKTAEQTQIMKLLLKNTISKSLYCDLVYTKYLIYSEIEREIKFKTPCLYRAQAALNDWQDMKHSLPKCGGHLDAYLSYLRTLHPHKLHSHVYVHYLAPLYGGQLIKKVIQHRFPTTLYDFDDAASAIAEVRQPLTVDMAPEANLAFEMTTKYYEQLYEQHAHDQLHSTD